MSKKDAWKIITLLAFAIAVVSMLCYARVNLGMTQEDINGKLESWISKTSSVALLVWSQIIMAVVCSIAYKVWTSRTVTRSESA